MKLAFCGAVYVFLYLEFLRQKFRENSEIIAKFNGFLLKYGHFPTKT